MSPEEVASTMSKMSLKDIAAIERIAATSLPGKRASGLAETSPEQRANALAATSSEERAAALATTRPEEKVSAAVPPQDRAAASTAMSPDEKDAAATKAAKQTIDASKAAAEDARAADDHMKILHQFQSEARRSLTARAPAVESHASHWGTPNSRDWDWDTFPHGPLAEGKGWDRTDNPKGPPRQAPTEQDDPSTPVEGDDRLVHQAPRDDSSASTDEKGTAPKPKKGGTNWARAKKQLLAATKMKSSIASEAIAVAAFPAGKDKDERLANLEAQQAKASKMFSDAADILPPEDRKVLLGAVGRK